MTPDTTSRCQRTPRLNAIAKSRDRVSSVQALLGEAHNAFVNERIVVDSMPSVHSASLITKTARITLPRFTSSVWSVDTRSRATGYVKSDAPAFWAHFRTRESALRLYLRFVPIGWLRDALIPHSAGQCI